MALNILYKTVLLTMINAYVISIVGGETEFQAGESGTSQTLGTISETSQKPAFTARTLTVFNPQNIQSIFFEIHGQNETIVFDEIITNTGNHYSPVTGTFVAPSAGQYFFGANVKDVSNRGGTTLHIAHNGRIVAEVSAIMGANPGQEPQGSNSVVLEMKAGDEVAVRSFNAGGKVIGSFTGFQI